MEGNWTPGETVPRTGTYKCIFCDPNGFMAQTLNDMFVRMGVPAPPRSEKTTHRFFKQGELFTSCPNCKNNPSGADPTGWDFVSEEEIKAPTKSGGGTPEMVYFECTRPSGDGKCSDNSCPCGFPGTTIPRGTGYFYISEDLVKMRRDALTLEEIHAKAARMMQQAGGALSAVTSGVLMPILMCEVAAKKRGVDLVVAAADAKYYWETGLAPLRPTPMVAQVGHSPAGGCFIATACYGNSDCTEVMVLRRFRDEFLLKSKVGGYFVNAYYRLSPPLAKRLEQGAFAKKIVRRFILQPIVIVVSTLR